MQSSRGATDPIKPWAVVDGEDRYFATSASDVLAIVRRKNLSWPIRVINIKTLNDVSKSKYLGPNHKVLETLLAAGKIRFTPSTDVLRSYWQVMEVADITTGLPSDVKRAEANVAWAFNAKTKLEVREAVVGVLCGANALSLVNDRGGEIDQLSRILLPTRTPNEDVLVGSFEFPADYLARDVVSRALSAIWANDLLDNSAYAFYTEPLRRELGTLPGDRDRPELEAARSPFKSFFNELAIASIEPIGF